MGLRRQSREIALQVLYQMEFLTGLSADEAVRIYLDNFDVTPDIRDFAVELSLGVWANKNELDSLIGAHSQNWKINRMAAVDKNILRIATFEMKFLGRQIPRNVTIDEAIEIGKRFGTQDSGSFINGVLDNIAKSLNA